MAVTKYKVIQKNLEAVINYAMNGEKTEHGILVSALNCLPKTAYSQIMLTKKNFHKEEGRLGYHIIQSFNGNEVSPQKANEIGPHALHKERNVLQYGAISYCCQRGVLCCDVQN